MKKFKKKYSFILGLSLLEVLIALTILSTITVLTAQALKQGFSTKQKIQNQLDHSAKLRDALNIIQKDINKMTNYEDIEFKFLNAVKKQAQETIRKSQMATTQPGGNPGGFMGSEGGSSGFQGSEGAQSPSEQGIFQNPALIQEKLQQLSARLHRPPSQNRKIFQTFFKGSDDQLFFFTTHSLIAPSSEKPIPPFITKVSYQIRPCPQQTDQNCLIRFSEPTDQFLNIQQLERVKNGIPILNDVKSFNLRYLGLLQQDWVTSWDSQSNNQAQRDRIPEAIEITLETSKIKNTNIFYVHFPNNQTSRGQQR